MRNKYESPRACLGARSVAYSATLGWGIIRRPPDWACGFGLRPQNDNGGWTEKTGIRVIRASGARLPSGPRNYLPVGGGLAGGLLGDGASVSLRRGHGGAAGRGNDAVDEGTLHPETHGASNLSGQCLCPTIPILADSAPFPKLNYHTRYKK